MTGSFATAAEREKVAKRAKDGNATAVQFLAETPDFMERGSRGRTCRKILKLSGDVSVGAKYDALRLQHNIDAVNVTVVRSPFVRAHGLRNLNVTDI
jgi:hypothetical protein